MFASVMGDGDELTLHAIAGKRRALDAAEAEWLAMVAAYDRAERWRADGFVSAAAALAAECHLSEGAARGHVELARSLEEMPAVAEAFGAGDVSRQHASVLAKACTPERLDAIAELLPTLVTAAARMPARELGAMVQHAVERLDGDGGAAEDERLRARRCVRVSRRLDRMVAGEVVLDPEGGEYYLAALKAEMQSDRREHETRTSEQRRADALENICRLYLNGGTAPIAAHARHGRTSCWSSISQARRRGLARRRQSRGGPRRAPEPQHAAAHHL
jgi:hypothetical protein